MNDQPPPSAIEKAGPDFLRKIRAFLPAILIAVMTLLAYLPAARGEFVWDDDLYAANPVLRQAGSLATIWTFGDFPDKFYYKEFPVTYSAFWLGHRLWGGGPAGFHLLNIFLHIVNACLVWLILKRLGLRWAWLAGAVFALHPVHVESVAWTTELKNVLSGLFFLLSVWAYQLFEEDSDRKWYWGAFALFLAALLSKPVAVTLPLVLLLLRWYKGLGTGRRELADLAPFFLASLAIGAFTSWLELDPRNIEISLNPAQKIILGARALWFYPAKLFWPAGLTFSYERWTLNPGAVSAWLWVLATVLTGTLLWRFKKKLGRAFFSGLWFYILNIFLFLGFVSIYTFRYSFVADHYQYLPSIGLIALAVGALERAAGASRRLGLLCALLLLPALGIATFRQSAIYKTQAGLWDDTLKKNPGSRLALIDKGGALKPEEAVPYWEGVISAYPDFYEAYCNLGIALEYLGRKEEGVAYLKKALELSPDFYQAHEHLAKLLASLGRNAEAAVHYGEIVRMDPTYAKARNEYGLVLMGEGKLEEAAVQFRKGIALKPDSAETHSNLGMALYAQGKMDGAVEAFRNALKVNPALPEAYNNMGMALLAQKKFGEAEDCFRSALTFKPEDYSFNFNWGVAAASAGKIGEAEKHLREARRLAPDNAVVKQTLQLVLQREQRAGMTVKSAAGEK